MCAIRYTLAIETSSPHRTITLGQDHQRLESATLTQSRRHNTQLLPAIDKLLKQHNASPSSLHALFVSAGPGSFTGLRVAVATAKIIALTQNTQLIAVPTLDVLAAAAPPPQKQKQNLLICLNQKGPTVFARAYHWQQDAWNPSDPPQLIDLHDHLQKHTSPLLILGHPLPPIPNLPEHITILPRQHAQPHADKLWTVGQSMLSKQQTTSPQQITPIYARPPEAVTLWNKRHNTAKTTTP